MAHTVPGMNEVAEGISDEFITCPVCSNAYKDPKVLPCMHSFCEQCLTESLQDSNISSGQSFLCPICRYQCTVPKRGVGAFPVNVFIETLFEFANRKASPAKVKEPPKPTCEGCEEDIIAIKKCVECDDWLCPECVRMHGKVKLTKNHHLAGIEEIQAGAYDEMLKDTFEPLLCGKHEEPLKLYCTEPSCQTPICTMCKATLGHDGHRAIEITEQGGYDVEKIQNMTDVIQKNMNILLKKIEQIKAEDHSASASRKEIHSEINTRMQEVVDVVVKQIGTHAEGLHKEVEALAKTHKKELSDQMDDAKYQLEGMNAAMTFAANIVNFGRSEEIVAMARQLIRRLDDFQAPPHIVIPVWRNPKLHPMSEPTSDTISHLYGTLTFQGELIKCVLVRSFSARLSDDKKTCSLSDVAITEENDIMIVDKDNKKVKVFDAQGELLFSTEQELFKMPNRVSLFKSNGNALIKDDKQLKILQQEGTLVPNFAPHLKQPVGLCQMATNRFLVTDWTTGCVHCLNENGQEEFKFPSQTEAAAYICSNEEGSRIALSDWKHNTVKVFTIDGNRVFQYGGEGENADRLNHPYGVAMDEHGHLLVADNWNNRIHLISERGQLVQYLLSNEDGLQWPQAIAIDREGNLVVAEIQGNVKVYKYLA